MKILICLLALACLVSRGGAVMAAEGNTVFPAIEGKALNGDKFRVPHSLGKTYNLVLVAFLREQQAGIDTWIPKLEQMEASDPDFTFYEFPVLPEMNAMARWWIYHGMRSGIRSESARARTVTFHLDKDEFRDNLDIETEGAIRIFLVDGKGEILWKASGRWSADKQGGLIRRIAEHREANAGAEEQ